MKPKFGCLALIYLSLSLCAGAVAQTPTDTTVSTKGNTTQPSTTLPGVDGRDDRYRIGYNDTVEVQVFRHPELTHRAKVNPNGAIKLPHLPPIPAVCKTEAELARDIENAYRKDYLRNPDVTVTVIEQRSQAFAVIGAVEKPGSFYSNRKVRLLELLALAGGPSKEAGTRMIVARTGSTSACELDDSKNRDSDDLILMGFKISDVLEGKQNLVMKPGDIISVLDFDFVYVYGSVKKQGQIPIKAPITLTQALATAEGLEPAAEKDKVRILRQKTGTLEREELVFNLKEIDSGKVRDPFLQPDDIVAVSTNRTKDILFSIGRSFTSGASTVLTRIPVPF